MFSKIKNLMLNTCQQDYVNFILVHSPIAAGLDPLQVSLVHSPPAGSLLV